MSPPSPPSPRRLQRERREPRVGIWSLFAHSPSNRFTRRGAGGWAPTLPRGRARKDTNRRRDHGFPDIRARRPQRRRVAPPRSTRGGRRSFPRNRGGRFQGCSSKRLTIPLDFDHHQHAGTRGRFPDETRRVRSSLSRGGGGVSLSHSLDRLFFTPLPSLFDVTIRTREDFRASLQNLRVRIPTRRLRLRLRLRLFRGARERRAVRRLRPSPSSSLIARVPTRATR